MIHKIIKAENLHIDIVWRKYLECMRWMCGVSLKDRKHEVLYCLSGIQSVAEVPGMAD